MEQEVSRGQEVGRGQDVGSQQEGRQMAGGWQSARGGNSRKRVHAMRVGKVCPTVNDAQKRGYPVRLATLDEYVTCKTCLYHIGRAEYVNGRVVEL